METESFMYGIKEPDIFEDAVNSEQSFEWKQTMKREMNFLKENETWSLTPLPNGA